MADVGLYLMRPVGESGSIKATIESQDLVFHKKLGEGNFGDVWQGKLRGTTTVAIKTIRSEDKSAFLLEAHIMAYRFPPSPPHPPTHHSSPTHHASHTGVKCRQLPAHPNVVTFFGLSSCDVRVLFASRPTAKLFTHAFLPFVFASFLPTGKERAVPGHRVRCRWLAGSLPHREHVRLDASICLQNYNFV